MIATQNDRILRRVNLISIFTLLVLLSTLPRRNLPCPHISITSALILARILEPVRMGFSCFKVFKVSMQVQWLALEPGGQTRCNR